ncbi:MAG TPA: ribonuclease E/G, partial [Mycobacterium sp.]
MPETPSQPQWEPPAAASDDDLPERLRVHSLARVLGTTSRRVLDALSELDGRSRSAQSTVERSDAVRVRDVLAQNPEAAEPAAEVDVVEVVEEAGEPESRLILETAAVESVYMPLFVAPQPVKALVAEDSDDEDDEDDDEDEESDAEVDDDQGDRPSNRRRRRGRRGRGRGRGEQGGADGEDSDQPAGEDKSEGA